MARDPQLWLSRSWTTRAQRPGEPDDAYHFVDRATFESNAASGGFLEWVEFLDYLQGTPVPDPPPGRDIVLEIDVQGARLVSERYPDALLIFIDAPSREEQQRRLEGRGDPPDKVAARMAKGDDERRLAADLGAVVVVNNDLDRAVDDVAALIDERRVTGGDPRTGSA